MSSAPAELVRLEYPDDGVARITLNRPDQRNAMNRAARRALVDSLEACRDRARTVVLTGAGPAFCAGIDLKEARADGEAGGPPPAELGSSWIEVQDHIRHHPAVFIAAVNGFALGGGVTLINSCDLALAAEDAPIGMPEASFGLYPGLAGPSTQLRIAPKHAAWLVLTAERISGRTAASWGLVNEAVPLEDLPEAALVLARKIARYDAVTLEWCKRALREIPSHLSDYTSALEFGEGIGTQIRARSDVVQRGMRAFAAGERAPGQGS